MHAMPTHNAPETECDRFQALEPIQNQPRKALLHFGRAPASMSDTDWPESDHEDGAVHAPVTPRKRAAPDGLPSPPDSRSLVEHAKRIQILSVNDTAKKQRAFEALLRTRDTLRRALASRDQKILHLKLRVCQLEGSEATSVSTITSLQHELRTLKQALANEKAKA
ncbi:hypothetical protein PYCC9005_000741 [Savitreella phatthalungensis]